MTNNDIALTDVRNLRDFRAWLYVVIPLLGITLTGAGVLSEEQATAWVGLAIAIVGPVVMAYTTRTLSAGRAAFYAVMAAVLTVLGAYGIEAGDTVSTWLPLIVAVVGGSTSGMAEVKLRKQA